MTLRRISSDVFLRIADFLPFPGIMAVDRATRDLWQSHYSSGGGGLARWSRISAVGTAVDDGSDRVRTLWLDSVYPVRVLNGVRLWLRRLTVQSAVQRVTESAVLPLIQHAGHRPGLPSLRTLSVLLPMAGLGDGFASHLRGALESAPNLSRIELRLSMNSVTVRGLTALVDGLLACHNLRELELDLCGNWIRGVEYGQQIGRLGRLLRIRRLTLCLGGWGVRKQFGLQYLM